MRLIIAGSREFKSLKAVGDGIRMFGKAHPDFHITEIVSGGCRGADRLGEEVARNAGLLVKVFNADWSKNGKAAGPIRNAAMAEYGDALLALFITGIEGRGTNDMVEKMHRLQKPVFIANFPAALALSEF
jgi:hypothetical protein